MEFPPWLWFRDLHLAVTAPWGAHTAEPEPARTHASRSLNGRLATAPSVPFVGLLSG
jgi:hypothetical protein